MQLLKPMQIATHNHVWPGLAVSAPDAWLLCGKIQPFLSMAPTCLGADVTA